MTKADLERQRGDAITLSDVAYHLGNRRLLDEAWERARRLKDQITAMDRGLDRDDTLPW